MMVAAVELKKLMQFRLLIFFPQTLEKLPHFVEFSGGSAGMFSINCHKNVPYRSPLAEECCTQVLTASVWALKDLNLSADTWIAGTRE